ncbi:MAG: hypothetical protein ACJAW3_000325 [Lentimonas sp.]|jgi:hypothetical protein
MFALLGLFFSYPHLVKYTSEATQSKVSAIEFKAKILKSITKHLSKDLINKKIEEINDNSEDQETNQ